MPKAEPLFPSGGLVKEQLCSLGTPGKKGVHSPLLHSNIPSTASLYGPAEMCPEPMASPGAPPASAAIALAPFPPFPVSINLKNKSPPVPLPGSLL